MYSYRLSGDFNCHEISFIKRHINIIECRLYDHQPRHVNEAPFRANLDSRDVILEKSMPRRTRNATTQL